MRHASALVFVLLFGALCLNAGLASAAAAAQPRTADVRHRAQLMTVTPLQLTSTGRAKFAGRLSTAAAAIIAGHRRYRHQPAVNAVPVQSTPVQIPNSFLGLSMEYFELPQVNGAVNAFKRVVNMLKVPGGGPVVLRIGGESADTSLWTPDPALAPLWDVNPITPAWVSAAARVLKTTGMQTIVDMNGLDHDPAAAAAWAQQAVRAFPKGSIQDFEIGNEPNLYQTNYGNPGDPDPTVAQAINQLYAWGLQAGYNTSTYMQQWAAYQQAIARVAPGIPLAGPATGIPATTQWFDTLLNTPDNNLGALTTHLYPLSTCANPQTYWYPQNERSLLSPLANSWLTSDLIPFAEDAHAHGVKAVVTEANSVTCGGLSGLSSSYGTALWAANALFDYADSGVDAIDIHVRMPRYNPAFVINGNQLTARPLLYGMAFFSRALTPGTKIMPLAVTHTPTGNPGSVHTWLLDTGAGLRVAIVNDNPSPETVVVKIPDEGQLQSQELLGSGGLSSQSGVTLAGQSIDTLGRWTGQEQLTAVSYSNAAGGYKITVPGYAASLSIPMTVSAAQ